MGDRIYKCNSGHIKAFPLILTQRPTLAQYTTNVDKTDDLIEFQWVPSVSPPITSRSTTGSIILETTGASTTTIRFNTLSYTIKNVQLTIAQHSTWLIADPGATNTGDLVILLEASSPRKQEPIYTIFVIPLLNTGSEATDPLYLKNTNSTGINSSRGVDSCFPQKTATVDPLFAHYVTCFDGYTSHAHTQNIDVFVSTVGVPVSPVTMNKITQGATPGVIELPTIIQNRYYIPPTAEGSEAAAAARLAAAQSAGAYADVGGITSVSPTQFPNIITTTQFSSSVSNVGGVQFTRKDPTNAYQCVELDPNEVDANNNIHIDMKSGKIASSTLDDILAEREVIKQLVNPDANIDPKMRENRKYYEFVLSLIIILGTLFGLYMFVFSNDTANGRSFWEILLSSIIALTLLIAAGLGFLGGNDSLKEIGGWMALASTIAGFLFFLYFYIIYPSSTTTECGKTAIALANGSGATSAGTTAANLSQQASINAAKAAAAAAEKEKGWPGFFNSFAGKGIQIGVTGAIFGLLGFIVGHII